jgi:hypothetical protein
MGVESEEKPLYLYLVVGVCGGFSPAAVLVADYDSIDAVFTAEREIPQLAPTAASRMSLFEGCELFDGEWEESLCSPAGPRVLAEFYE